MNTKTQSEFEGLSEEQRYLFDTFGYLVLEGVLSADQVAELRSTLRTPTEQVDSVTKDDNPLHWGEIWRTLLDLPSITPILEEIIGNHATRARRQEYGYPYIPTFRIDHINVITNIVEGFRGGILHGGWKGTGGCQFSSYHDGHFYNGLISVSFELYDTHGNDGGFCCIPGSHKANLRLPENWRDLSKGIPNVVKRVPANAGDVILFTEALTHGTLPWEVEDTRKTLFYKYSPNGTAWSRDYYDPEDYRVYPDVDDRKLALLEAPNARYHGRPTAPNVSEKKIGITF